MYFWKEISQKYDTSHEPRLSYSRASCHLLTRSLPTPQVPIAHGEPVTGKRWIFRENYRDPVWASSGAVARAAV